MKYPIVVLLAVILSANIAGQNINMKIVPQLLDIADGDGYLPVSPELLDNLMVLRELCFGQQGQQYFQARGANADGEKLKATWLLLRCEYSVFIARTEPLGKQAAAWRVIEAAREFRLVCVKGQFYKQEPWSMRLLNANSFCLEALKVLPSKQSEATVYETVYAEIIRIFSPAGNNPVNRQIQSAWRNAMIEAEETSVVAIAARLQAIDSLKQLYGLYPENKKAENLPQLSPHEIAAFYNDQLFAEVVAFIKKMRTANNSPTDIDSIIQRYIKLRNKLGLANEEIVAKQFPCINRTYCNRERENQLLQIYQLFQDVLKISLPKDDDKLEQEIRQLIAAGIVAQTDARAKQALASLQYFKKALQTSQVRAKIANDEKKFALLQQSVGQVLGDTIATMEQVIAELMKEIGGNHQ